ncbi:MAG: NRDE family protein, partial [Ginsengibacter sp.]
MCTVTFIPVKDKYFITSNRDEKVFRKAAIPPQVYRINGRRIMFPKDGEAGGSWIALHENGNAAVLLNGAFVKHDPQPAYACSRGLIFLEIIRANMRVKQFMSMNLFMIEPFTIILFDHNDLYECRWDGNKKHFAQLEKYRPYIWSSATLYGEETVKKREGWFAKFLNKNPYPSQADIFNFHKFSGDGDKRNDLLMNRDGVYSTVSVTGIELNDEEGCMQYLDLENRK